MHIETLQTFCHLVEAGSFAKAAALGFVSQSAVSQQLKTLEARYGCTLIERGARRQLAPTDAGRLLYAECRELLDRFRQIETRLRTPSQELAGTVRLATVYSIGLHELPPYVSRFMKAHPHVKVHVEYSRTDKVCDACADGTVDFGIVAFPLRRSNLTVIPWHEEKLVLACAPTHRLARRRTVRLTELEGEPFIAFERDIPTRRTIDRVLRTHRVSVDTVMEFDNVETIKRSVEVGTGLSILPATTVTREARERTLATADFAEGPFTREVGIVHRRGRAISAAAREFVHVLVGGPQRQPPARRAGN
jgi:LysR family transcriptional regulator, transcriptional activator of the cysJI operon